MRRNKETVYHGLDSFVSQARARPTTPSHSTLATIPLVHSTLLGMRLGQNPLPVRLPPRRPSQGPS